MDIFESIIHGSPIGVATLDPEGRVKFANRSFLRLMEARDSDVRERSILHFIDQEDREKWENFFRNLTASGVSNMRCEIRYHPINNLYQRWGQIDLSRIPIEGHAEPEIVAFFTDITDKKAAEMRLVKEREASRKAQEAAEQATRTKSDFLANMSHEIRTPIHTIIGTTELLNETSLDPEQQEYGKQISFSADVLLALINDILDFSKIEAGKLNLEVIEFDLYDTVQNAVDMVALEAHKKNLEVVISIDSNCQRELLGDPVRLRQVIVNLFNNAVKFTREGQILTYVKLAEETEQDILVRFSVEDSGIGIPRDKMTKLFQSFSQVDSSTTRRFGGTGLGLSISRNLSSMMGGEIGVESIFGEGSTFWFTARFKKRESVPVERNLKKALGLDPSVLIIDENITSRMVLRNHLEEWNCRVVEAVDGENGLEILREYSDAGTPFTICLIDLLLPRMDGWQVASEINADTNINSTKLVLMSPTGKSGDEAKMKLLQWFDRYTTKPIHFADLYDTLENIMEEVTDLEAVEENDTEPDRTKYSHTSILIAEDNEVNQQMFQLILETLGCRVSVAADGHEAVDCAEHNRFDIIFMDVQMPRMNGYEAATRIRELGINIPIIAVTASAVKGEREKCLAAGMTDFLSKPFKKKDILPLFEQYAPVPEPEELPEEEDAAELEELDTLDDAEIRETQALADDDNDADESPIFDLEEALDTFMGKKDVVQRVLQSYIAKVKEQLPKLEQALSEDDFESIRAEAHSVKGSSWNMHVQKTGDIAALLEQAGREQDRELAENTLPRLKTAFDELLKFLKNDPELTI